MRTPTQKRTLVPHCQVRGGQQLVQGRLLLLPRRGATCPASLHQSPQPFRRCSASWLRWPSSGRAAKRLPPPLPPPPVPPPCAHLPRHSAASPAKGRSAQRQRNRGLGTRSHAKRCVGHSLQRRRDRRAAGRSGSPPEDPSGCEAPRSCRRSGSKCLPGCVVQVPAGAIKNVRGFSAPWSPLQKRSAN